MMDNNLDKEGPGKVLIVDDIPGNLQLLSTILYRDGFDISAATSGKQALEAVARNLPDIILLDVSMPEMDGYEVCRKLKEEPDYASIPVIFLTARTESEDIVKGFESGAVDYIVKPFNAKELISRVFTHLELKKSRDRIKEQNKNLIELNTLKDKLFSIMAHDLRNPVGSIIGLLELLENDYDVLSEDKKRKYISTIRTAGINMYALLSDLLEWARTQFGAEPLKPENIPLKASIDETVELFHIKIGEKNIRVINSIPESITVYADKTMLKGVIRNLLSNSLKFSHPGGMVTVNAVSEAGVIKIEILDTGVGINPEDLQRLFRIDQHITKPGTANEKGTGLGLIICKDFIEKNNGQIWVASEVGKGTTFTFTVPETGKQKSEKN